MTAPMPVLPAAFLQPRAHAGKPDEILAGQTYTGDLHLLVLQLGNGSFLGLNRVEAFQGRQRS